MVLYYSFCLVLKTFVVYLLVFIPYCTLGYTIDLLKYLEALSDSLIKINIVSTFDFYLSFVSLLVSSSFSIPF